MPRIKHVDSYTQLPQLSIGTTHFKWLRDNLETKCSQRWLGWQTSLSFISIVLTAFSFFFLKKSTSRELCAAYLLQPKQTNKKTNNNKKLSYYYYIIIILYYYIIIIILLYNNIIIIKKPLILLIHINNTWGKGHFSPAEIIFYN